MNGSPTQPFEARKGLRQGDLLSPFLIVLAMEYLTRRLKALHHIPDFNYHPKCAKMQIMQLGFADDLLLFCRGDMVSIQLLYNCFLDFSKESVLEINKKKSSIFFGGVSQDIQADILEFLGIQKWELPVRYLGVPLSSKRVSLVQCKPLLDKLVGRITSWTVKLLPYAGRLQLIKSVLFSIQTYWAQIFMLPKKITKLIEAICGSFLWTEDNNISKKDLLAWEKVCQPMSAGGFNVLDIGL
ncbi:PREDICTED: uncharacterized protein LOC109236031 [Nicotiana attenuata]|uniref:uncharacterized protein LOC109236031 n=1 Tax=Nicotiana attenuata TaxID=49451 RepID=UPI0009056430|nr:PREDICTED: uncharacterized protein LOC109236031 [Nicotiana attenuata]